MRMVYLALERLEDVNPVLKTYGSRCKTVIPETQNSYCC